MCDTVEISGQYGRQRRVSDTTRGPALSSLRQGRSGSLWRFYCMWLFLFFCSFFQRAALFLCLFSATVATAFFHLSNGGTSFVILRLNLCYSIRLISLSLKEAINIKVLVVNLNYFLLSPAQTHFLRPCSSPVPPLKSTWLSQKTCRAL